MKNYISRFSCVAFFVSILCANTAWSVTAKMTCVPDPREIDKKLNNVIEIQKLENELEALPITQGVLGEDYLAKKKGILLQIQTFPERADIDTDPKVKYFRFTQKNHRYTEKDYAYEIKIQYDTDKFAKEHALYTEKYELYSKGGSKETPVLPAYKFASASFSRTKYFASGVTVYGFYPEQQDDISRLGFIFGKTSYIDSSIVLGNGYNAHLAYSWILYRKSKDREVKKNPLTGQPLAPNEYLLYSNQWHGTVNDASIKYIEKLAGDPPDPDFVPPRHDFHFLPGVQICTKWIINGQEVVNNPEKTAAAYADLPPLVDVPQSPSVGSAGDVKKE